MNAHVEISYPELIAELDYERKENARLAEKLVDAEKNYHRKRDELRNSEARYRTLKFKLEKIELRKEVAALSDKEMMIDGLMLNIENCEYRFEMAYIILKLQFVDAFWSHVKLKTIDYTTQLIRSMIDPKNYKIVLENLGDK